MGRIGHFHSGRGRNRYWPGFVVAGGFLVKKDADEVTSTPRCKADEGEDYSKGCQNYLPPYPGFEDFLEDKTAYCLPKNSRYVPRTTQCLADFLSSSAVPLAYHDNSP
jgi:hypothetical protein